MGLLDSLLGKKKFCSVCGQPISGEPIHGDSGELYCSQACSATIERLSQRPVADDRPSPYPDEDP